MKQVLLMIVVMALVGCGAKPAQKQPAKAEATPKSEQEKKAKKPESQEENKPKTESKVAAAPKPGKPFTNTLGMKFVAVPGTEVAFCIWETRVKDYAAYVATNSGVGAIWKKPGFKQGDTHPVVTCIGMMRRRFVRG